MAKHRRILTATVFCSFLCFLAHDVHATGTVCSQPAFVERRSEAVTVVSVCDSGQEDAVSLLNPIMPDAQLASPPSMSQAASDNAVPDGKESQASAAAPTPPVADKFALMLPAQTIPRLITPFESDENAVRAVERNVYLFSERMKVRFAVWLERSSRYLDAMKGILRDNSVPEELVFLPFVESGFSTQAFSRARAAGPWQFIEGTARRYGLTVDWWRDERKDPLKSTRAAATYLGDLYRMFGSWNLALAAYNAGEGKISKALRRSDADDYWDLLHTSHIRRETKEYVPRYIAATMIASEPERFGFSDLAYHEPLDYDEVVLHGPVDLDVIARCAETDTAEIRELNPELRRWSTPPNLTSYTIRIPADSREIFIGNLKRIPSNARFSYDTYKVKKKENLQTVAKKLRVPVTTLCALNGMGGVEPVSAGEVIKVPPKDKFQTDVGDRMSAKKVSGKKKFAKGKKSPKTKQVGKKSTVKGKKIKTKRA